MDFRRDIWNGRFDLSWIKVWSRVGFFSALDSLLRNVVYLVVVLRAMNLLKEQVRPTALGQLYIHSIGFQGASSTYTLAQYETYRPAMWLFNSKGFKL